MFWYGWAMLTGLIGNKEEATGVYWLEKAIQEGHLLAKQALSLYYLEQNDIHGEDWVQEYIPPETFYDAYDLGTYWIKQKDQKKHTKGIEFFQTLINQGNKKALQLLGYTLIEMGKFEDGIQYLEKLAQVDGDGALFLAEYYIKSDWFSGINENAWKYLQIAIQKGSTAAMTRCGTLSITGHFVPQNVKYGTMLLYQAAEQGDLKGMFWLAYHMLEGDINEREKEEALTWLTQSAKEGYFGSIEKLRNLYRDHPSYQDQAKAKYWSNNVQKENEKRILGLQGEEDYQLWSELVVNGRLLDKSAELGNKNAMFLIASNSKHTILYKPLQCLDQAADLGMELAKKRLEELQKNTSNQKLYTNYSPTFDS